MFPGSGAKWFQRNASKWSNLANKYGYGSLSVRPSTPFATNLANSDAPRQLELDGRVLPFASINLAVLLLESLRSAHASSKQLGACEHVSGKASFDRLCHGILCSASRNFELHLRIDKDVQMFHGRLIGKNPGVIRIVNGVIDVQSLETCYQTVSDRLSAPVRSAISFIIGLRGMAFTDFFVSAY